MVKVQITLVASPGFGPIFGRLARSGPVFGIGAQAITTTDDADYPESNAIEFGSVVAYIAAITSSSSASTAAWPLTSLTLTSVAVP